MELQLAAVASIGTSPNTDHKIIQKRKIPEKLESADANLVPAFRPIFLKNCKGHYCSCISGDLMTVARLNGDWFVSKLDNRARNQHLAVKFVSARQDGLLQLEGL